MRKVTGAMILLMMTAVLSTSFGQKIKIVSGSLAGLKGEKTMSTEFTYDNMKVGNEDEKAYIKRKKDDYNKKEAGRGEKWESNWVGDRKTRYEGKFFELFEKASKIDANGKGGKYKMVFHTMFTEPGFNVYVTKRPAAINAEVTIIEVATGKEVAKVTITGALGRTYGLNDMDTGVRIQECYAMAGKAFGKFVVKNSK